MPAPRTARRRRLVALLALAAVVALAVVLVTRGGGSPAPVADGSPATRGSTVLRYEIASKAAGRRLAQTAVRPRGSSSRPPLLVFLHGRGADRQEQSATPAFFAALAVLGDRAPAVVFPDGEDHSYWHDRDSGAWTRYVLDEVIPQAVRRLHADPRRVAIGGISMGGFGAYAVARARPAAFCAVGGHSPALWAQAGETAPGAFDDAEDFAHNDLLADAAARGTAPWGTARLWLDGGLDDPFRSAGERFATSLGIPMRHWKGAHETAYWEAHYGAYLRFYADALGACAH